jgi:hypothetical protein
MRYLTLNEVLALHGQVMAQSGGAAGVLSSCSVRYAHETLSTVDWAELSETPRWDSLYSFQPTRLNRAYQP